MQRIQDPTAVAAEPATPALTGPVGFFAGSLTSAVVTRIRAWWLNMIQEELCALLTLVGFALDGTATVAQAVQFISRGRWLNFTQSGSWICPPGVYYVKLRMIAGGGGGSGSPVSGTAWSGSGGGAGGYIEGIFAVVPGTAYPVVIGPGGPGGAGNDSGSNGGNSSFGNLASCTGGLGGLANAGGGGGSGATGTSVGEAVIVVGGNGSDGVTSASNVGNALFIPTGNGADGPWGGRGPAGSASGSGVAHGFGAGGGGAYSQNNISGGAGGGGLAILEF